MDGVSSSLLRWRGRWGLLLLLPPPSGGEALRLMVWNLAMSGDPVVSLGWLGFVGELEEMFAIVDNIVAPNRGGSSRYEQRMLFEFLQRGLSAQPEISKQYAILEKSRHGSRASTSLLSIVTFKEHMNHNVGYNVSRIAIWGETRDAHSPRSACRAMAARSGIDLAHHSPDWHPKIGGKGSFLLVR